MGLLGLVMIGLSNVLASESSNAKILNQKAYQQLKQGEYQLAFRTSKKALQQSKDEKNTTEEARAISNIASNLKYLGENERALKLYSESLKLSKLNNDIEGELRAINNIAGIYSELENESETLKFRQLQLLKSKQGSDKEDQLIAYIGLTQAYVDLGQITNANSNLAKARQLLEANPDPFLQIYVIFSQNGIYEKQKKYDKALQSAKVGLIIAETNKFNGLITSLLANVAEYQLQLGQTRRAKETSRKALKIAEKLNLRSKQLQIHRLLGKINKADSNYQKALLHTETANILSQSISGEKILQLAEVTKIDRQVAKTEQKLIDLQLEQEILNLKLDKQQQKMLIWFFIFSVLFVSGFFWYYRRNSKKEILRQKQLNEQLTELDRIKDRVLTNTSHELRTPLNGIVGLSEIMLQDNTRQLPDDVRESIGLIKTSGEQLALVINDILEMSKLKHDKLRILYSDFDLDELISDVVKVCTPLARDKSIEIKSTSLLNNHSIKQDRKRLQQILFNVIGNAVKFTDSGFVEVSCKIKQNQLSIVVNDTGIGIPKGKLDRVFEGFEQVDSGNNRTHHGSGLGLAISRTLAEALGGQLVLNSALGKGTCVSIILPLKS